MVLSQKEQCFLSAAYLKFERGIYGEYGYTHIGIQKLMEFQVYLAESGPLFCGYYSGRETAFFTLIDACAEIEASLAS